MPRLIRPNLPSGVEAAISFMGSRAQADVLRQLAILGPSTIGQLQYVLEISRPSLNRHLEALAATGLIKTDPPRGMRQGRDVTYELQPARIQELSRAYVDYIEGR
ncbi:helix-turn-helix transcriptional regulator [Arthrobacter sp. ISL-95]|nr:helix-turn-helix transcriptional regulator [Arthrobacter sp. ISL-95]